MLAVPPLLVFAASCTAGVSGFHADSGSTRGVAHPADERFFSGVGVAGCGNDESANGSQQNGKKVDEQGSGKDEQGAGKKVNPSSFYGQWDGHRVDELRTVLESLRSHKKKIAFFAGDSSLDNKFWFMKKKGHTKDQHVADDIVKSDVFGDAVNGYEKVLKPPRMAKDVAYWMNLKASKVDRDLAVINSAVEESTLAHRDGKKLLEQDKFIRDNIGGADTLIVSVGGNDIAFGDKTASPLFEEVMALQFHTLDKLDSAQQKLERAWKNLARHFEHKLTNYITELVSKTKPARVILCFVYFPSETKADSWAKKALDKMQYDSHPGLLQSVMQELFERSWKAVQVKGTKVVPFPMYEVLDGTKASLYEERIEPSIEGGEVLGQALLDQTKQ